MINAGGLLAQFVGDEVVALFGIPDQRPGYVDAAMRTTGRLLDIAASVCHSWQRWIGHVQPRRGAHVGMAMGRVQLVTMRAFDHARLATIGDCMDIAARLLPLAGPGEIVVSNVLRHVLRDSPYELTPLPPFEARNIGSCNRWKVCEPHAAAEGDS